MQQGKHDVDYVEDFKKSPAQRLRLPFGIKTVHTNYKPLDFIKSKYGTRVEDNSPVKKTTTLQELKKYKSKEVAV